MKITVNQITNKNVVHFSSPYGDCLGVWSAGKPKKGDCYVELDVSQLEDSSAIYRAKVDSPALACENDTIFLRGLLEDYEDDGFLTLKLGDTCICVETPYDERVANLKGEYIALTADCLYLYDGKLL
jgi:hypothetical protein